MVNYFHNTYQSVSLYVLNLTIFWGRSYFYRHNVVILNILSFPDCCRQQKKKLRLKKLIKPWLWSMSSGTFLCKATMFLVQWPTHKIYLVTKLKRVAVKIFSGVGGGWGTFTYLESKYISMFLLIEGHILFLFGLK